MVRIVPQHHPFHDQHEGAVQAQQGGDQQHPGRAEGPGVPAQGASCLSAGGNVCGRIHGSIVGRWPAPLGVPSSVLVPM
ncbi:hypothetical protein ACFFX0_31985 [Citricoccus parietis]|uniref:Uncharacterized protein n=1 Tax=Citricoccus parietis TaxID=592307 RepID=A0ABV5G9C1_9MICC